MQIEAQRLTKIYRGGQGLQPLTLSVQRGEFVAVVGHNGAGKSTFLKLLAGWLRPDDGDALIGGVTIRDRLTAVRQVGFVPETPNLYEQFSVEYNLQFFARLFALPAARSLQMIQEFELSRFRRSKVQTLSNGLRQRVSLGRSLLADPDVILLDEPTSGLDFDMTQELYRRLETLQDQGKTILFTSHRPEEVRRLATRVVVLHNGKAVFAGAPDEYFQSKAHQDLYQ